MAARAAARQAREGGQALQPVRAALALLFFPCLVYGQGLAGSETVILPVDAESIYAHLYKPAAKGKRPAMVLVHGFDGVSDARVKRQALEDVKAFLKGKLL